MKKSIVLLFSLIFLINSYSQTKTLDKNPEGMMFIPQGLFEIKNARKPGDKEIKLSVDAFWMSNEISNAKFREFVLWAKNNPDKNLYQSKYSVVVVSDKKKGIMKDTSIVQIIPIEVSSFSSDMLDPLSFEKVNKNYKDYFTNKKYNDFPVVGVSFKIAEYYCLWKTMMEN